VWIAPSAAATQPEETLTARSEETSAPQATVQTEPEQELGTDGGPERDGFSEVFAAAFGNENDSSTVRETNGSVEAVAAADPPGASAPSAGLPEAPNAEDRYGDVWSDPADDPDKPKEPAVEPTALMTSSLDDESVPAADELASAADPAAPSQDPPAAEDESVSVEDDLWALRARLAHAADDHETQKTPTEEPRWS